MKAEREAGEPLEFAGPPLPPDYELCGCGSRAVLMDPHNEGDCPLEFCEACFVAEEERLRREHGQGGDA